MKKVEKRAFSVLLIILCVILLITTSYKGHTHSQCQRKSQCLFKLLHKKTLL